MLAVKGYANPLLGVGENKKVLNLPKVFSVKVAQALTLVVRGCHVYVENHFVVVSFVTGIAYMVEDFRQMEHISGALVDLWWVSRVSFLPSRAYFLERYTHALAALW